MSGPHASTATAIARNPYVDTLRGIAIWGVVCVHFAGSFLTVNNAWTPTFYVGITLNQFFSFAVPLFIFLSGLLAGWSRQTGGLGSYYTGRFRRIGVPYLIASLVAFFLMGHFAKWMALPTLGEKFNWLAYHLGWVGVEPTFYFIPLIIQLYLLYPLLRKLPDWVVRCIAPKLGPTEVIANLSFTFLLLHLGIGLLCYFGSLNYYVWGRPFALFWLFYFFAGIHFKSLAQSLTSRWGTPFIWICGLIGLTVFGFVLANAMNPGVVGLRFESNEWDKAYVRPSIMIMNLTFIIVMAGGIARSWRPSHNLFIHLGPSSLTIYLWHIMLIYVCVWRYPEAMRSITTVPELLGLIPLFVCFALYQLEKTPKFVLGFFRNRHPS